MGVGNLDNCPRCGKLYVKNPMMLCAACIKDLNEEYEKCADYMRKQRTCTVQELSDVTGVAIKQITRFIREGRLSIANAPNMGYPCDSCHTLLRQGTLCDDCRNRLTKGFASVHADEKQGNQASPGMGFLRDDRKK
jgi:flagellar operon protein (TIGR03826 family)